MTEILIKDNIISDDKVIHFYNNDMLLVLSKYNDDLEFYSSSFEENVKLKIEALNECAIFNETIGNNIESNFIVNVHTDKGLEQRNNQIKIYKNNGEYILDYINNSNSNFYHYIKKRYT